MIEEAFNRCALDLLIDTKYLIQEQFNDGHLSPMEYYALIGDVQHDIDAICPIDISFI